MKGCGLKYKAIFMTIYGGGLRVSELCNLRIQDIDSKSMRILVRQGKESKSRSIKRILQTISTKAFRKLPFYLTTKTK